MNFDIFQHDKSDAIECDVQIRMIRMRDGVRLYTRIYIPVCGRKMSTVFSRSPYNSPDLFASAPRNVFIRNEVVYIAQDCRGSGQSEGKSDPYGPMEQNDGEDTINWIASQDWSNGRVGMSGASYGGSVQWLAALRGQPELVAITPFNCSANLYEGSYIGGALFLQLKMHWTMTQYYRRHVQYSPSPDWDALEIAKHHPLRDMDKFAGLGEVPYWRALVKKSVYSEAWDYGNMLKQPELIRIPAYIKGGWFDFYNKPSVDSYLVLREEGGSPEVRNFTRLVMGPWTHGGNKNPDLFADLEREKEINANGDKFLLGLLADSQKDPLPDEPAVRYFMMGKNEWREADSWPPAGTTEKKFYLHGETAANTSNGGGCLNNIAPSKMEPADHYSFDPANPVLSRGGGFLGPKECGDGCVTQMCIENRQDVLCYTSEPLEDDLEIAGHVKLVLQISSSCKDTDFTGKLVDVHPDGTSYNVLDGIQRARFRKGSEQEVFLIPGETEEITVDLWHTAHTFLKGHCIRIHVSSSNFPHFDPNMNTGNKFGEDATGIIAEQTVFHDAEHPSYIILPVLSNS